MASIITEAKDSLLKAEKRHSDKDYDEEADLTAYNATLGIVIVTIFALNPVTAIFAVFALICLHGERETYNAWKRTVQVWYIISEIVLVIVVIVGVIMLLYGIFTLTLRWILLAVYLIVVSLILIILIFIAGTRIARMFSKPIDAYAPVPQEPGKIEVVKEK